MTPVDEELRRMLRAAVPPTEPVSFEEVAQRVRRRRTALVSVAVAATMFLVLAASAVGALVGRSGEALPSDHASPELPASAVPWVGLPAPEGRDLPTAHRTPPAADARPCRADDVTARQHLTDGAGGHLAYLVGFRNTSGSACLLRGYPAAVVATEPGAPDVRGTDGSFFPSPRAGNISPGRTAFLVVETDSECGALPGGGTVGPTYHHLAVTLPGGGTVPVDMRDGLRPGPCGLHIGRFHVEQPTPPEPKDPLRDIRVSLRLPRTIVRGSTLVYGVRLTNRTDHPASLDPCPGYFETLLSPQSQASAGLPEASRVVPGTDYSKASWSLNCAPVGAILAHGSTWFAMRLDVPVNVPAGRYTVEWSLIGGQLLKAHAGGPITVVDRR